MNYYSNDKGREKGLASHREHRNGIVNAVVAEGFAQLEKTRISLDQHFQWPIINTCIF